MFKLKNFNKKQYAFIYQQIKVQLAYDADGNKATLDTEIKLRDILLI